MRQRFLIVLVAMAACAMPAAAQLAAPVYDGFNSAGTGFDLPGWTVDPASTEGVGWAVDASPASIVTGLPSTYSPLSPSAGSLNFNDGVDFNDATDLIVSGGVMSPVIDVSTLGTSLAVISYKVAISMEVGATSTPPTMGIEVYDATTGPPTYLGILTIGRVGDGTDYEIPQGEWCQLNTYLRWELFTLSLVQFRFVFDSGDGVNNGFSGMFIDEFRVSCEDDTLAVAPVTGLPVAPIPPSTPTLLAPILLATVTNPVAFDWTDCTDTTPCGPSGISVYQIDIDDDPLFASINFTQYVVDSATSVTGIPAGTWYWRVRALDEQDFNYGMPFPGAVLDHPGAYSTTESFYIEPEIAPDPPTLLFVNEGVPGAQSGRSGFVDPVLDDTPAFSAVYTDPNTIASAIGLRFQIALDPAFVTIVSDSGPVGISPSLPKDSRCPDLTIGVNLVRDTTYYWRIAFEDGSAFLPADPLSGLTGPFSAPQSFRIGDDFEFGVRHGSNHAGRRCWVATAAIGSPEATPVQALQSWRFGTMESSAAGRVVSRAYHVIGAEASTLTVRSNSVAGAILPLASILGGSGSLVALGVLAVLAMLGISRVVARM